MTSVRLFVSVLVLLAAGSPLTGVSFAESRSNAATTPRPHSATAAAKVDKHKGRKGAAHKPVAHTGSVPPPLSLTSSQNPSASAPPNVGQPRPAAAPIRSGPPMAMAATTSTAPMDLAAVKTAIELVHKNRLDEATNVEQTIADPLARKLVEWVILRSDAGGANFSRYASFIAANPSWPSIVTLRRRAEAELWQQQVDPQTTLGFFGDDPPLSAKGFFALARALLVRGDTGRAVAAIRTAWRTTGFSEDVEAQARSAFAGLITPADDKARMDARLYAEDVGAGMRAAHHLSGEEFAIAKARAAVIAKSPNAKALLDAVPNEARHDAGYMFSRIHWLRHHNDVKEAAQLMLAAPLEPSKLIDFDQWWVERRLISRKLLDLNEPRTAYEIAANGPPSPNENHRAEQQFTAGWIALRFLHEPGRALTHFARIAEGVVNPITLARSYYWQARAAQALGHEHDAHALYARRHATRPPIIGQLARAQLHVNELTIPEPPQSPAERRPFELARVFGILCDRSARHCGLDGSRHCRQIH